MRILVTGGTGYLGSLLVDRLHHHHQVVVIGHTQGDLSGVRYLVGDYADPNLVKPVLEEVDVVYHLAWSSVPANTLSLSEEQATNVKPSLSFIDLVRYSPVKHTVFLSSAGAVYGGARTPFTEDTVPQPLNQYGNAKATVETYLQSIATPTGKVTILRVTNAIGPTQAFKRGQGLLPALIEAVKTGKPLPLWGNRQKDYISDQDVVGAMLAVLDQSSPFEIYNIGSGTTLTTRELVDLAQGFTGSTIPVQDMPPRAYDTPKVEVSTAKLETDLGWQPKDDVIELIQSIVTDQLVTPSHDQQA